MTGSAYYIQYDELEGVIGSEAASALVEARGGTRFYIGEKETRHRLDLAAEIGMEAARILVAYVATGIGGLYVEIPNRKGTRENSELRRLAADRNLTEATISKRLGVHMRTVRRMRAKLKKEAAA